MNTNEMVNLQKDEINSAHFCIDLLVNLLNTGSVFAINQEVFDTTREVVAKAYKQKELIDDFLILNQKPISQKAWCLHVEFMANKCYKN